MGSRLNLHSLLVSLLGSAERVYFQPPPSILMGYPAIVYERDYADTQFASNFPYVYEKRYKVTVIDKDPDSPIPDRIGMLPRCVFSRHFKAENLNHDVFNIYF